MRISITTTTTITFISLPPLLPPTSVMQQGRWALRPTPRFERHSVPPSSHQQLQPGSGFGLLVHWETSATVRRAFSTFFALLSYPATHSWRTKVQCYQQLIIQCLCKLLSGSRTIHHQHLRVPPIHLQLNNCKTRNIEILAAWYRAQDGNFAHEYNFCYIRHSDRFDKKHEFVGHVRSNRHRAKYFSLA